MDKKRIDFLFVSSSNENQIYYIDHYFGLNIQYMIGKWIRENFATPIDEEATIIDTYCRMVLK